MGEITLMNQTWNNFVDGNFKKIQLSLNEFAEMMKDSDFIEKAINKINYQERMSSCQYIKKASTIHGFANIFLLRVMNGHLNQYDYYFVYKPKLVKSDLKNLMFLPAISEYKINDFEIDSIDYLANFAIAMEMNDYIYYVRDNKLAKYEEYLN